MRNVFLILAIYFYPWPVMLAEDELKIVEVKKIWDEAPHNAFTDLIRFKDQWFCVFREGKAHVSPDGALRVIRSKDGKSWESAALLTSKVADLRDAKIAVTHDGQLMLNGAGALHERSKQSHQSYTWFSKDGKTWTEPQAIGEPNSWLWRVTPHDKNYYSFGYGTGPKRGLRFYHSNDGKKYDTLIESVIPEGYPNETALVFQGDQAYCLLRRDGKSSSALLGTSKVPYKNWKWQDLKVRMGGPQMLLWPDGRLLATVRLYEQNVRTSLVWIKPKTATVTEAITLPSGGDTSYAGMVKFGDELWVSYYSSHEKKTAIYLARIAISGD